VSVIPDPVEEVKPIPVEPELPSKVDDPVVTDRSKKASERKKRKKLQDKNSKPRKSELIQEP